MAAFKLVLLRHGESLWDKENRFTGWTDVPLTDKGRAEAKRAAVLLKQNGFIFDFAFTSVLTRAIHSLWIVLDELQLQWLPVEKSWRLNERHYGALQGFDKTETAKRYGLDLVHQWRRSYGLCPPALSVNDVRYAGYDRRYASLSTWEIPLAESLAMTSERILPLWHNILVPRITNGDRLLIITHGNSIRALVKHLRSISDEAIVDVHIR
jgi:2,3-bisphosphoglycerate-dependent phosphoglycerate mutase